MPPLRASARWGVRKTPHKYWGHVWQGRYKSPRWQRKAYYLEAGRYIERNPLRAKLVTELKAYPWSSYGYYAFGQTNPLVDEDPYYANLGATPTAQQQAYRDFVRLETPYAKVLDGHFLEQAF